MICFNGDEFEKKQKERSRFIYDTSCLYSCCHLSEESLKINDSTTAHNISHHTTFRINGESFIYCVIIFTNFE